MNIEELNRMSKEIRKSLVRDNWKVSNEWMIVICVILVSIVRMVLSI